MSPSCDSFLSFRSSADRSQDPWLSKEYKSLYPHLMAQIEEQRIREHCVQFRMITGDTSSYIASERLIRRRKKKLLSCISTTHVNFGKFREILRADVNPGIKNCMDVLDSVGPDPQGQCMPNISDDRAAAAVAAWAALAALFFWN